MGELENMDWVRVTIIVVHLLQYASSFFEIIEIYYKG